MKYLKISSLLVLSLLLFAPAALADVECRLQPNLGSIRAESMAESIEPVDMRCEWAADDITAADVETDSDGIQYMAGSTFDLVLRLSARPINDHENPVLLHLPGDDPRTIEVETDGYDVAGEISGPNIRWPGEEDDVVSFPLDASWDLDDTNGDSGTFTITGIMVDATTGDNSVTATADMTAEDLADGITLDVPSENVTIAGIDQALTMALGADAKVATINSCDPKEFKVLVDLREGFRTGWSDIDNIQLMVSSGTITGPATMGVLTRLRADGDMLTYEVDGTTLRDSTSIELTIQPDPGDEGDVLYVSVMFIPTTQSSAKFIVSDKITVGTYGPCEGDSLLFPFISNKSGFDTGIVILNTSELSGSCGLMWDGEEVEDLKRVPAMGQTAFILSMENPDFQGWLKLACEFSGAHGYAYITDLAGITGAQGYLARRSPDYN